MKDQKADTGGRFLTVKEFARALQISTKQARRLVLSGALPHYRFGRCYRIDRDDFEAFIAKHRVK